MDQEQIGKFIIELRKENNMTQEQLAEKMGVTDKSISRWENGKTMPDISLLVLLADNLNTTIQELLNGRRMTKDELVELKGTFEKLIEYESNKQIKNSKRINKYIIIGNLIIVMALLHNEFSYLNYIFTPNAADFVQGCLYGMGIVLDLIGVYNNSHNITVCEKKKELIKKLKTK